MPIQPDAPLDRLNTLGLPARARALAEPVSEPELLEVLAWARARALPVIPLGQGSNVVLAGDLEALVVHQRSRGIELLAEEERVRLRVAAGEDWHGLVSWSLTQGCFGLENLALIPGTVGAAPVQNIGAYGVELAPRVKAVHGCVIDTGECLTLSRDECRFAYRDSLFKGELRDRFIITSVELSLDRRPAVNAEYPTLAAWLEERGLVEPTPLEVFEAVVAIRRRRLPDPGRVPNVGSFFKNPVIDPDQAATLRARFATMPGYPDTDGRLKVPAAWLIEQCGWKGRRRGAVGVHPEHALVLVNHGGGSGGELLALAAEIRQSVAAEFGIDLVLEPRVYGDTRG